MNLLFKKSVLLQVCFLCSVFFMSACSSKDDAPDVPTAGLYSNGFFVLNQGNFSDADASIDFFTSSGQRYASIFENKNSRPLACILESMRAHQNRFYLVGNGADKLEVVDAKDFSSIFTITEKMNIPRDFQAVGSTGVVSCWGPYDASWDSPNSYLVRINLSSGQVIDTLAVPSRPGAMQSVNGKIFVACTAADLVLVFDPSNNTVPTTFADMGNPVAFQTDKDGYLWVLGNDGTLTQLNTGTMVKERSIDLPSGYYYGSLQSNANKSKLYCMNSTYAPDYSYTTNEVFVFDLSTMTAPTSPLITGTNLYALGINPNNDQIVLGNNNAFAGNGTLLFYGQDGTALDNKATGRAPYKFLFVN